MADRNKFVGTWVSTSEKEEIKKVANKENLSISELIRQRVIKDNLDKSEVLYILMDYIGSKLDEIKELILYQNEKIAEKTETPIERIRPPSKLRSPEPLEKPELMPQNFMGTVLEELKGKLDEIKERFGIEE
jgi:hypothetical protein